MATHNFISALPCKEFEILTWILRKNLNKLKPSDFSWTLQRTVITKQIAILDSVQDHWIQSITASSLSGIKAPGTINWWANLNSNFSELVQAECGLAWEWETLGKGAAVFVGLPYFYGFCLQKCPPGSQCVMSRKILLFLAGGEKSNF